MLDIKDNKTLVDLTTNLYKNENVSTKFSKDETLSAISNKILEVNNGKAYFDIRDIRAGECNELFAFIETVLAETEEYDISQNPFFNQMVEYRNIKLGDANKFVVYDDSEVYVSRVADGTQGLIRQRFSGGREFTVDTAIYVAKVYDELTRVLACRSNILELIKKVHKGFNRVKSELILNAFLNIAQTNPNNVFSKTSTSFVENDLLDLCYMVEAKNNNVAPIIMGTKKALRNITLDPTTLAEIGKEDRYNMGYYGKFNGYDVVSIPNTLKRNSEEFYLPDNVLWVIGTASDKPVKFVSEGEPFIVTNMNGDIAKNCDLTQEFLMTEKFGANVIVTGKKNGIYTIA